MILIKRYNILFKHYIDIFIDNVLIGLVMKDYFSKNKKL